MIRLTAVAAVMLALLPGTAAAQSDGNLPIPRGLPPSPATDVERTETTLAPGLRLEEFTRVFGSERARVHVLRADLASPALTADLLFPGVVSERERTSVMADRSGAIAGVNGDFFDSGDSEVPNGTAIAGGELLKSFDDDSETGGVRTAGIVADESGRVGDAGFTGSLSLPGGPSPLAGVNRFRLPADGVGLYTSRWGERPRERPVEKAGSGPVRSALVRGGVVQSVQDGHRAGLIPADGFELLGREGGAQRLAALEPGSSVGAVFAPTFQFPLPTPLKFAVGGVAYLVRDGKFIEDTPKENVNRPLYPRTGIGFAGADRRTLLLVVVDGRQVMTTGMSRTNDFAKLMLDLGAVEALHLDGGGSATMVARQPGAGSVSLINETSDGGEGVEGGPRQSMERTVPNGIGIFYDAGGRPGPAGGGASVPAPDSTVKLGARFTAGFTAARYSVAAGRPLRVSLFASERARLRVEVLRGHRRVGRFTRSVGPGRATVTGARGLRPGRYGLRVVGRTAAGAEARDVAALLVKRGARPRGGTRSDGNCNRAAQGRDSRRYRCQRGNR